MKKIEDKNIEKAKQKFFRSLFFLFIAIIYLISPIDFVPGPFEDIPLLVASAVYTGLTYHKLKRQQEKFNS